jgi:hypothetical protein
MNQLFAVDQLQPFAPTSSSGYGMTDRDREQLLATASQTDLIAVIGFCAIGLILTFAALIVWPGITAAMA